MDFWDDNGDVIGKDFSVIIHQESGAIGEPFSAEKVGTEQRKMMVHITTLLQRMVRDKEGLHLVKNKVILVSVQIILVIVLS